MEAVPQHVITYTAIDGSESFMDWFDSCQDANARSIILERIARVRKGNFGWYRPLKEDLYELKISKPAYRVYYGVVDHETVVLLWGGTKNTQKKDIKKAQKYWDEFRSRFNE